MFEIFPEGGHWCARRSDGLVCGLFRDRAEAERFARLEDEIQPPSAGHADARGRAQGPLTNKTPA